MNICATEQQRLIVQGELDSLKSSEERNRWGQFATPPSLAADLLRYALVQMGDLGSKIRFLDPAVGTGSFYSALRKVFIGQNIDNAIGVELDPKFATVALNLWHEFGLDVIQADFTKLEPADCKLFNLVICNPPYVRHHHIEMTQKEYLQRRVMH
jgi:predicted RNA methylase